jgi:hypothetical protein
MMFFDRSDIQYLKDSLYIDGELQVKPHDFYRSIPINHIQQFCVEEGVYCLPTTELIEFLREHIIDSRTIEIGAGHGAISRELGIRATDSKMQDRDDIALMYAMQGQGTVKYGKNVEVYDGIDAIRRYKPKVVISAWVTHKYNLNEHFRHGNMYGVKEETILEKVDKYIFVGNTKTHKLKPILDLPHKTIEVPWLVSRVMDGNDIIWIWERK